MPVPKKVVDEFEAALDEYGIQLLDAFDAHAREYEKRKAIPFIRKFDEDQPRDESGRWTDGGGGGSGGDSDGGGGSSDDGSGNSGSSNAGSARSPKENLSKVSKNAKNEIKMIKDRLGNYRPKAESDVVRLWEENIVADKLVENAVQVYEGAPFEKPEGGESAESYQLNMRGIAADMLIHASEEEIDHPVLERVISARGSRSGRDPLYNAKEGEEYDLPLVAFTAAELTKGEKAGEFYNESDDKYKTRIIRFENPEVGYDISAKGKFPLQREVIVTGRVKVVSVKNMRVPTYDFLGRAAGNAPRKVITVARF